MELVWTQIALLAVWLLLPLLPAVLIYHLFPDTPVTATGPLKGLTINVGGAFGAYLITVLVAFSTVHSIQGFIGLYSHPFWTIRGHLKLIDKDGKEITSAETLVQAAQILTHPDILDHQTSQIIWKLPEEQGRLPEVIITIPNPSGQSGRGIWGVAEVDLNDYASKPTSSYNSSRDLSKPIVVHEIPRHQTPDSLAPPDRSVSQ